MKPYPASFPSTAIFSGMSREEIESILHCLGASQEVFPKAAPFSGRVTKPNLWGLC